jgi:hypothetical protein
VEGILTGLEQGAEVVIDDGWDEFNFEHVVQVHKPLYKSKALMFADFARTPAAERRARFQALFEEATERWTAGTSDHDYDESFPAFVQRVSSSSAPAGRSHWSPHSCWQATHRSGNASTALP